jgi:hypothetical protein
MSPLGLFPTGRTSPRNLLLDWRATDLSLNARTGQLGPYTRASTGTVVDANGVVCSVANNVPRFGYSNGLFGLLLEGARTNSWPYSNDAANWAGSFVNATASLAAVGPDGVANSASSVLEGSANSSHLLSRTLVAVTANMTQSVALFLKANGRTQCELTVYDTGTTADAFGVIVDLVQGTVTVNNRGVGVLSLSRIVPYGTNGWYRIEISGKANTTATAFTAEVVFRSNGARSYVGDTTKGFYWFGAQHEKDSAFPSSYIPTTTVAVTRAADALSFAFNALPQVMTVYAKYLTVGAGAVQGFVWAIAATAFGTPYLGLYEIGTSLVGRYDVASVDYESSSVLSPTSGATVEGLTTLSSTSVITQSGALNGGATVTGSPTTGPTLPGSWGSSPILTIGNYIPGAGGLPIFGVVQSLRIAYDVRTLAQIQSLDLN